MLWTRFGSLLVDQIRFAVWIASSSVRSAYRRKEEFGSAKAVDRGNRSMDQRRTSTGSASTEIETSGAPDSTSTTNRIVAYSGQQEPHVRDSMLGAGAGEDVSRRAGSDHCWRR
jgi:hypothetical protein